MNNKIGACIWSLPEQGPEACQLAADVGLAGIELDMGKMEEDFPISKQNVQEEFLSAASNSGIMFPSLAANVFCSCAMTKEENGDTVRNILEKMASTADAMGIPLLQLPSFVASFVTSDDEFDQTVKSLRIACDLAADHGLLVGTENALSVDRNLELFEKVNRDNLRWYYDISNPFWMSGLDSPAMIKPLFANLCEVHVKDEMTDSNASKRYFAPLGSGGSSFDDSMKILLDGGYNGWIILENDYAAPGKTKAEGTLIDILKQDIGAVQAYLD